MLSMREAAQLAAVIGEATGQTFTDEAVMLFRASLDQRMTFTDAVNAFAQWNKLPHDWHKVTPGDLNAVYRQTLPGSRLTVNHVQQALIKAGLEGDELWAGAAPKRVIDMVNAGVGFDEAIRRAVDQCRGFRIEPAPARAKPKRVGPGFNPNGLPSLKEVIGG